MSTAAAKSSVTKNNIVQEKVTIHYVDPDAIRPNFYNPNRISAHDLELLCKSILEDGFTRPIKVNTLPPHENEIVDGEQRWRAHKALWEQGLIQERKIPVFYVKMTPEQMRLATLRHNVHGDEDAALAADVLRDLANRGAIDYAQDQLMLDDVEVQRLLEDMPTDEANALAAKITQDMLGPTGHGLSPLDQATNPDLTADERRAKERILAAQRTQEEDSMRKQDNKIYRLMLIYTGDEAELVKRILSSHPESPAAAVLAMCQADLDFA